MPRNHKVITPWTGPEVKKLRELYPSAPWDDVIAAFPRHTSAAIRGQAARLHISRPRPDCHTEGRHPLIAALVARQQALGLSTSKVADDAGIDRTAMFRLKNQRGHGLPSGRTLEAWATALGLELTLKERRKDCSVTAAVEHMIANPS